MYFEDHLYFEDHSPPHFHARYGEYEALIQISPIALLRGDLPPRALSLVIEWAKIYQKELMEDWNHAANHKKLHKIPPFQ